MFLHFGWKLPIQGQILGVLGVNRGEISIFHFITPKKAHPCAIPRLLSHCASKSVQESLLYVAPRKKINKKSHKKLYFTPFAQKSPVNGFLPNLEPTFLSWT